MKAYLMHRGRDFDLAADLPWNADALIQDLELTTLLSAMAAGDRFLFDIARRALLSSLRDPEAIRYRQQILDDCLRHPAVVRDLYTLAVEAVDGEKKIYGYILRDYPEAILHRAVQVLQMYLGMLRRLRRIADEHADAFRSDGFTAFFATIGKELGDEYLYTVAEHLRRLELRGGALISAELGEGNKGTNYVLRKPHKRGWVQRLSLDAPRSYTYRIPERDENGARALSDLRNKGINLVADALAQSGDHIRSFFSMLRAELAFYVGGLNLHERLSAKEEPTCLPDPLPSDRLILSCRGLYDVCLSLNLDERRVVGNDVDAHDASLLVITGANQGGKSTLLRGIGLAQLMMQAGMLVPAESFRGNVCDGVVTHFRREEDETMTRGKLDEELARMSEIADHLVPSAMVLLNESFSSTNEREGSQIAREIIRALREARVKVAVVTHLYDLAHSLYTTSTGSASRDGALFLRAERGTDGRRTFKLRPGEPLPTSFGEDLYTRIFGNGAEDVRHSTS